MSVEPNETDRLIRLSEVKQRVGLGKTLIYAMIAEGRVPKPYKITPAAARWSEREIGEWVSATKAGPNSGSPVR
jgi:prophage regulatory protein